MIFNIKETEVEKLNNKGEYIKVITYTKKVFGIKYRTITKTFQNKITQDVLDALDGEEAPKSSKKKIGFNN